MEEANSSRPVLTISTSRGSPSNTNVVDPFYNTSSSTMKQRLHTPHADSVVDKEKMILQNSPSIHMFDTHDGEDGGDSENSSKATSPLISQPVNTHSSYSAEKSVFSFLYYPELERIEPTKHIIYDNSKKIIKWKPPVFRTKLHELLYDDNPYLFSGYRKMPIADLIRCFWSMFQLHNEFMNIWTHFIPLLLWLYYGYQLWFHSSVTSFMHSIEDRLVFTFFIFSASITMIMSCLYHMFRMNSVTSYHFCLKCDLRGIVLLLCGNNAVYVYFSMNCWPFWRNFYFAVNVLIVLLLAIWIPHMVKYRLTNQRTVYFALYSFLGFIAFLQRMYYLYSEGLIHMPVRTRRYNEGELFTILSYSMEYFLKVMLIPGILSGLALIVRNIKAPERFFPYKFDIFGASHQIFHVLTAVGAWFTYYPTLRMYLDGYFSEQMCLASNFSKLS